MSRQFRYSFVISLLLSPAILKAQSVIELTNSYINELQKSNREAIFRFSNPHFYIYPELRYESDTSKKFIVSSIDYVVYREKGKNYMRKIVDHYNEDGSNVQQVISEIILFDDSLYHWLVVNIATIRNERILPFEYHSIYEDSIKALWTSHTFSTEIGIYSSRESFEKIISDQDLRKWSHHHDRNLNFEANLKTTLFIFHQKMEEYFRNNDHRFKFLKYIPK